MTKGICSTVKQYARALKQRATKPEKCLYSCLEILKRTLQIPFDFQRPFAIAHRHAILDFYCPMAKLAIEVDGGYHNTLEQRERDQERTDLLFSLHGIRVLRLPNALVLSDRAQATELILAEVLKLCKEKSRAHVIGKLNGRTMAQVIADGFARYPANKLHLREQKKKHRRYVPLPAGVVESNYFQVSPEQLERERKAFEKHLRWMERKGAAVRA